MASIAYITDSKLLEYHRLNQMHEINFWRLSTNINFSSFGPDDLLFFLSKDRQHMRDGEKGIVGYGRCVSFHCASVNTMWRHYGQYNGYQDLISFKEAIKRVAKDHKLPTKISSIYLKDLIFFSSPVYLSDCGKNISRSTESYTYLDDEDLVTLRILESGKDAIDIWTNDIDPVRIETDQIRYVLYHIYDKIAIEYPNNNTGRKALRKLLESDPGYSYIKGSKHAAYKIAKDCLYIVQAPLYIKDKIMEERIMLGQKVLYERMFAKLYPHNLRIIFGVAGKEEWPIY